MLSISDSSLLNLIHITFRLIYIRVAPTRALSPLGGGLAGHRGRFEHGTFSGDQRKHPSDSHAALRRSALRFPDVRSPPAAL